MTLAEPQTARPRAVRFSFAFDDAGIRLIGRCERHKVAPRGDDVLIDPRPNAITVELHSREGEVLYRQTLVAPIRQTVELVGPGGRLSRRPVAPRTGAFTVVVPNLAGARAVVLWRGPAVDLRQRAFTLADGADRVRRELARVAFERR